MKTLDMIVGVFLVVVLPWTVAIILGTILTKFFGWEAPAAILVTVIAWLASEFETARRSSYVER